MKSLDYQINEPIRTNTASQNESLDWMSIQVAKGGGVAFMGSVIGKISNLGLHILLGRVLGPAIYGLYALGISIISITRYIALLGLKKGLVRFCAIYRGEKDDARVKGTIVSAFIISFGSSLGAAAFLCVFSKVIAQNFFNEPGLTWVLRAFAIGIPFLVFLDITTSFAQSFRRIDYQQGVENVFLPLINLIFVGLAFLLGYRIYGAIGGFIISAILSAGLGFYFLSRIFPQFHSKLIPISNSSKLLRFSLPTLFLGLSYLLMTYTDRIMLGYFGKATEVGVYNAAAELGVKANIFLNSIILISSPLFSDLYNKKMHKELNSLFKITTKWAITFSLPFLLFLAFFSLPIMQAFGPAFISGSTVLTIIAVAQLINVCTGPLGPLLQMTGKQDIDFINGIGALVLNIGLNILLIPKYGAIGAAIALGISIAIFHTARLIEAYRLLKIFPYDSRFLKPLTAGIAVLIISIAFRFFVEIDQWYILLIIAFLSIFLIYFAVFFIMGLDEEDKMILSKFRERFIKALGNNPDNKIT